MSAMDWMLEYSFIFFDFDGLLVKTEHLHFKAYNTLLKHHGVTPPWDFSTYIKIAHKSSTGLRKTITSHAPQLVEAQSWDTLYKEKAENYQKLIENGEVELMPGVKKLLKKIQSANIPHAVVTHSPFKQISFIREQLPLLKKIPHWITRENYQNPKPAPDAYLKAIDVLGASGKMLGFEDALKGIHALEGASITPILVCSPDHPQMKEVSKDALRCYPSLNAL